ncbi:protein lethal(2)essential for life-like [Aricia agestis]|uniref:protein lethal(2)essential for life-like n=1 Tax=Aricia agestis TaxID=91739 RepID=UPI001C20A3BC|nr:protein lethal(2)essential for life-like [Aricia agestis]
MHKHALLALALLACAAGDKHRRTGDQPVDPFAVLDKHISHSIAYQYLWPWSTLIRAAAALDLEDSLEDPQIISDSEKYQINLKVRRFKPEELRVKVKNKYVIVEGKQTSTDEIQKLMANHFVQRFVLPAGTRQEEVTAVLSEKGILSIYAPKHELPPPPPERDVPIQVILPEEKTEKPTEATKIEETKVEEVKVEETTKAREPEATSSPVEEATTHAGKIRKKELKTATKTTKDNEVTKGGDGNGLDYALIESDE